MKNPFTHASWLAPSETSASPIITRDFTLERVDTGATLYVTGLGYFEAYLNGTRLGDELFQPVASDYEHRSFTKITYPTSDVFTHRIYYRRFEVASLLREGENRLEIRLGGGFYVQLERIAEGEMSYSDRVKCIFTLKNGDTELNSDGSERWSDSEITYSNLFIGEIHDFTAKPRSGRVVTLPSPESELTEQIGVPDRLIRTISPRLLAELDGKLIFDAGENVSGLVALRVREGFAGEITLRFAENLRPDGSLDFASTGLHPLTRDGREQIMCDRFICDGKARELVPKFVWHAFRCFELAGVSEAELESVEVRVIHADMALTAEFESDSEGLNFLFDAYVRTQLNNCHGSFPSDCPHRERLGYTGDGQICAPTAMLMLNSREFYRKWIRDILDCQCRETGHVQHTAPFQGGGGGPGGWGCAVVLVPYYFYRQFGEREVISECFEPMLRWIEYLKGHMEDGLVTSEVEGGWCLGDWCTLDECKIPEPLVNSCYLVKCLRIIVELAVELGREDAIPALKELDAQVCESLRRHYYDETRKVYSSGTQGADAYLAELGLQDVRVVAEYYERLGHFDTGFLGTDILCELLFREGYGEVAYRLLAGEGLGSYLHMKRHGATTIWERWTDKNSSNDHPMFGAPARQLFAGILGIRQCEGSYGWERIRIKPYLPEGMSYARGSIQTPRGRISVTLERRGSEVRIGSSVPDGIEIE